VHYLSETSLSGIGHFNGGRDPMFDMLKAATGRRGEDWGKKRKTSGGGWKKDETKDKNKETHESHH
jgi:hypothetical protein